MFQTLFKLSLSTILLLSFSVKTELFQNTKSSHYLLLDLEQGEVLEEKGKSEKIYPASLTKMMVVYVALNHIEDKQKTAIISPNLLKELRQQGAAISNYPSQTPISYEDLLYGIALPSGADCSITLAKALFPTTDAFVQAMNQEAKRLGMIHSHFDNVTGLHSSNHYTTLEDLSLFLKVALKNPHFRNYFSAIKYTSKTGITLSHTLYRDIQKTGLKIPGYQGSKTGYTAQAGHCLALWFNQKGHSFLYLAAGGPGDVYTSSHLSDAHLVTSRLAKATKKPFGPFDFFYSHSKEAFFSYCLIQSGMPHLYLFQRGS